MEMDSVLSADEKVVCSSKRKKKRFCDHCDRLVSIRTLNAHKRKKTVDHANSSKCDCEYLLVGFSNLTSRFFYSFQYSGTAS